MAVDVNEFNNKINLFLSRLPVNMQGISKGIALTAVADIKRRIVNKGTLGDGSNLGQYSDKPLSPGLLIHNGMGIGADRKVQQYLKKNDTISYKKFRELNNRPTKHVTLSFTGETLNDISVLENQISGTKISTVVASKNSKQKDVYNKKGKKIGTKGTGDVLEELSFKYGDVLSLTPQEEKDLTEAFDEEVQNLINKFL